MYKRQGISFTWNLILAGKESFICLNGSFCKIYTVCAGLEMIIRFIESDMAVWPDAKKLQVYSADILKECIICFAAGCGIQIGSIWNISIININVYSAEQIFVHKITVALVIGCLLYTSQPS